MRASGNSRVKAVLYTSPLVPSEWIAAHGFVPRRFLPRAALERTTTVSRMGVCPYARALANEPAGGKRAAGVVVATTCDQMRRVAELIQRDQGSPVFLMNVPCTWQTAAARRLYREELRRLGRFLERLGGTPPSKERLLGVMGRQERFRSRRRRIVPPVKGVAIMLLGGPRFEHHRAIFDLIRSCGGRVVVDGTETGERTWPAPFDLPRARRDPVAELARTYFGTIPDVFRRPDLQLHRWIKRMIKERQVRGIIGVRHVWCDLWHAEMQRIKEWVRVPLLNLELDADVRIDGGRTVARVQAFMEMLR